MKNQFSKQTRIAVVGKGSEFIFDVLLHTINFLGKTIDSVKYDNIISKSNQDFVLILANKDDENLSQIDPTIAVITDFAPQYEDFLQSITAGGILIYNSENENCVSLVENSEKYCRKIPFQTPISQTINNTIYLETDLGIIPTHCNEEQLPWIDASKLLCQHIGIQEEEFYEAFLEFVV